MSVDFKIDRTALEAEFGKRSLYEFVKMAWSVIEPSSEFLDNWHIEEICRHLEGTYKGEVNRLVINVPPGSMKTLLTAVFYPAWLWIHEPSHRFLFIGYSLDVAKNAHLRWRTLVESDWYQQRWGGNWEQREESWGNIKAQNNKTGVRECASITGSITGKHYDTIFIDDPIKPIDTYGGAADTKKKIDQVVDSFTGTIQSRLTNQAKSRIVIIMQRLHEQDLAGFLLRTGEYEHLCIPLHFEQGRYTRNKLGIYDRRQVDRANFWPEKFTESHIVQQKSLMGPIAFAAQYQQSPVPAEGGAFKREWFNYYKELPADLKGATFVQSWDTTLSDSATSDYVVGQVWMRLRGTFYLVDQVRARMAFPETCAAIRNLSAKWPKATRKYIEEAASGKPIIQTLKKDIPGIIGVKVSKSDKESRVNAISGLWEAGNIMLPDPMKAPWINDFVEELLSFPKGRNDDQVDAMSQALLQLHHKSVSQIAENLRYWIGSKF